MASTKRKYKHPLVTRRAALTKPLGVFSKRPECAEQSSVLKAILGRVVASI